MSHSVALFAHVVFQTLPRLGANIIFTSGTTGDARGVCTPHRSITARLRWLHSQLGFADGEAGAGAGLVAVSHTAFPWIDHVFDIFGPITAGMTVVLVR